MGSAKNQEILVIDDEEVVRTLTKKVLAGAGYLVRDASNIKTGLELARQSIPHLIVLDLKMPDGSGFDFLEQRRKFVELVDIPILVLSGLTDKDSIYQANALGASEYAIKPLDARTLVQKVKKLLRDREFTATTFDGKEKPKVRAKALGKILNANEVGFLFEVPFKIAPNTALHVTSPLLDELECTNCLFQKTKKAAKAGHPGQYLNEISVVGLGKQAIKRIREIMRGWK